MRRFSSVTVTEPWLVVVVDPWGRRWRWKGVEEKRVEGKGVDEKRVEGKGLEGKRVEG